MANSTHRFPTALPQPSQSDDMSAAELEQARHEVEADLREDAAFTDLARASHHDLLSACREMLATLNALRLAGERGDFARWQATIDRAAGSQATSGSMQAACQAALTGINLN